MFSVDVQLPAEVSVAPAPAVTAPPPPHQSSPSSSRTLIYQSNKPTNQINRRYMYLVKNSKLTTKHVPVTAS